MYCGLKIQCKMLYSDSQFTIMQKAININHMFDDQFPNPTSYPTPFLRNSFFNMYSVFSYTLEVLLYYYLQLRPSASAGFFFFVEKRGGGLWPCIDYLGLNQVTNKYRYPIQLVPVALEQLQEAKIFNKLDLWSVYNLVHIREVND